MANPEHLEILLRGVQEWNHWRLRNPDVDPDLTRINLNTKVLIGVDFSGANFVGSSIIYSELPHADFSRAFLKDANFTGTALPNASLKSAILTWTNFSHAKLDGADFSDAYVGWTTFGQNDLSTVKGLETVVHHGPSVVGIETIYTSQGNIPEVFLRGCGVPENFITYMHSLIASGKPIQFYSCFISYSSKNQLFADRLYSDLQNKGVRCWLASEDLKIGDRIRIRIDESIRIHEKLLLVLSKYSVASDWVDQEVETALNRERKEKRTILFPIRLDDTVMKIDTGWPALIKNTRNIGDFRKWKNPEAYQKAFERLLRDLKAEDRCSQ